MEQNKAEHEATGRSTRRCAEELEAELAQTLTLHNKESSELHWQIAQLMNQLEQGQAETQELEERLSHGQRLREQAEVQQEREGQELKAHWQGQVANLSKQCQEWEKTLDAVQQTRVRERKDYQQSIFYKDKQLTSLVSKLDELKENNQQLQLEVSGCKRATQELAGAVSDNEDMLKKKDAEIKRKEEELAAREAEGQEAHKARMQDDPDELDAEQARNFSNRGPNSHRNSHSNIAASKSLSVLGSTNVTQKKVHQDSIQTTLQRVEALEGQLSRERGFFRQLQFEHDFKVQQVKELHLEKEAEVKAHQETKEELDELSSEYRATLEEKEREIASLRQHLKMVDNQNIHLESKCQDHKISMLDSSQKIRELQDSIDKLQCELCQAQENLHQIDADHVQKFHDAVVMLTQFQSKLNKENLILNSIPENNSLSPSISNSFMEQLHHFLVIFMEKYEHVQAELHNSNAKFLSAEQTILGIMSERDGYKKKYGTTEKLLKKTAKNLQGTTGELLNYRTHISALQGKLQELEDGLGTQSEMVHTHHRKTRQLRKRLTAANDTHVEFLHSLQNDLCCVDLTKELCEDASNRTTLMGVVRYGVQSLVKELELSRVDLKSANNTMARQKSVLEIVTKLHEDAVSKLSSSCMEKRKDCCKNRLVDLKLKYDSLLTGQEKLLEILQTEVKNCAEEMSRLKMVNRELEAGREQLKRQLEQLRCTHKGYKTDRACLLSCVCLLLGSVFPLYDQVLRLRFQKQYLTYSASKMCAYGHCVHSSASGVEGEGVPHFSSQQKFRAIALAIIAVNRLRKQVKNSSKLSGHKHRETRDGRIAATNKFPVCLGRHHRSCRSLDQDTARWLRSEAVLEQARQCMTGLQARLDQLAATPTPTRLYKYGEIKELVLNKYMKFIDKTHVHFRDQFL